MFFTSLFTPVRPVLDHLASFSISSVASQSLENIALMSIICVALLLAASCGITFLFLSSQTSSTVRSLGPFLIALACFWYGPLEWEVQSLCIVYASVAWSAQRIHHFLAFDSTIHIATLSLLARTQLPASTLSDAQMVRCILAPFTLKFPSTIPS